MFSGALKLADLNDFIAPSQACVVSLEGGKLASTADAEVGTVQLQQRPAKGFSQTLPAAPDQPVKVSLHDCLACSGCVTSAETVLLQHQSTAELLQRLSDRAAGWTVVVSLSPQSVAALAALHGLGAAECAARLATFLRQLGAAAVFDIAAARQLALAEAAQEFVQRFRRSARCAAALAAAGADAASSSAAAAAAAAAAAGGDAIEVDDPAGPAAGALAAAAADASSSSIGGGSSGGSGGSGALLLPMLASACPGWVCYAEKTHGDHALPYISTGKSPQAVMGTLVKQRWCAAAGLDPARVYHCAIMPCYDKKLEASREDFWLPGTQVPETDSVLATSELQELLEQKGITDLRHLPPTPFDSLALPSSSAPAGPGTHSGPTPAAAVAAHGSDGGGSGSSAANGWQQQHAAAPSSTRPCVEAGDRSSSGPVGSSTPGTAGLAGSAGTAPASSGSGGYLEHVFRTAAWELFGRQLPPDPLQMKVGRNADLREVCLEVGGAPVLRFAAAYGFRNIQGLMRKVKLQRCVYDYVEVMACPSGCLNGGGQPKPAPGQTSAQLLEQLELLYGGGDTAGASRAPPEADAATLQLYSAWVGGGPGSKAARQLLHTQYHKREKTVTAALADW